MKRKVTSILSFLVVFVLIMSMFSTIALAAPSKTITITNLAQLKAAIANQQSGQTWIIKKGNYGLTADPNLTAAPYDSQTGWYMPIVVDNLTIKGDGNPVLYGADNVPNGAWASQDLIAIFGKNCVITGLTLEPKVEINKTIEVIGNGNISILSCVFKPNTFVSGADPKDGGSLYFNGNGKTMGKIYIYRCNFDYCCIAFDGVKASSIKILSNTFKHIADGVYAIGNTYWGDEAKITDQFSSVTISNNGFYNVKSGDCIIKARLNQTFSLSSSNRVNNKKIVAKTFKQYIVFGNTPDSRYAGCTKAKVVVNGTTYTK